MTQDSQGFILAVIAGAALVLESVGEGMISQGVAKLYCELLYPFDTGCGQEAGTWFTIIMGSMIIFGLSIAFAGKK